MSKIVLLFKNEQFLDYFSTLLAGVTDIDIISFKNPIEANSYLLKERKNIVLYIVQADSEETSQFAENVLSFEVAVPLIIIENQENLALLKKKYKSQTLLEYFDVLGPSEMLFKKIEKLLNVSSRAQSEKIYCKVNLSFFYSTTEVFCDVYIRISEQKYLKVMNRYEEVDTNDIKKLDQRNIKHLYVRKRDFGLITKKMVDQLRPLVPGENALAVTTNDALSTVFSIQLQETVSETIQKIGLSNEAVEMTNIAINSTMQLLERAPEIYQILKNSIRGQSYSSEHSFLLSYIACSLLKETSLETQENLLAITIAAFFHDVSLCEDFCPIQSKKEYAYKSLGMSEQEEIIGHPTASKKLVEEIEGIPQSVGIIIAQHHEQYDGSGFPMGLDYKRISALSAIFNVAHELSQCFYESGNSKENTRAIIAEMNERYLRGNYKTAMLAASKVFLESTEETMTLKEAI